MTDLQDRRAERVPVRRMPPAFYVALLLLAVVLMFVQDPSWVADLWHAMFGPADPAPPILGPS